ncbi:glycoside hydrolase family 71 protein [Glonium stellatum]|uniref:Glycoside hydrolase family 71 protein n=1 Tax=Glonium stellatum TaxID=574774 RepID=A0A8E2F149_9PEZI|nr:glycoside hydrolase family 71 protein [Glonium stellatum]
MAHGRAVFAQYMVGTVTEAHAHQDIDDAVAMGLDGFALNIGDPTQPYVRNTLNYMFDYTRNNYAGRLWLYFSLDIWASGNAGRGIYPTNDYHALLQEFKDHAAYYKGPNGHSFISTFGDGRLTNDHWRAFRREYGNALYFVPDFDRTQGYYDAHPGWWAYWEDVIDGAFSWEAAWPIPGRYGGAFPGDIAPDKTVIAGTAAHGKSYMMAISALLYRNVYNSNVYRGGELNLPTRMAGILSMSPAPDYIQVISWNDGPGSHYIGNLWPEQNTDAQPSIYATQKTAAHDAWRPLIASFIQAFKAGLPATSMTPPSNLPVGTLWYKSILQRIICPDERLGGYYSKPDGFETAKDQLNWAIVVPAGATGYSVRAISNFKVIQTQKLVPGLNFGAADRNVEAGVQKLELLLNGKVVQVAKDGRCITDTCPDGIYNMNPQVVGLTTGSVDGFCLISMDFQDVESSDDEYVFV